jgi:hypothetical protein
MVEHFCPECGATVEFHTNELIPYQACQAKCPNCFKDLMLIVIPDKYIIEVYDQLLEARKA